jgi:hypothetical protein
MNVLEKPEVAIKNEQFRDTDKTTQNEDKQHQKIQRVELMMMSNTDPQ